MKIFHNFDTDLKKKDYMGAVNRVGKNKVILVERAFYYWLLKGLIPLIFCVILNVGIFILFIYLLEKDLAPLARFILTIWIFILIWWLIKIMNFYINYKLDFSIITSGEIITHNQKGFFQRNYKNIPSKKIRSIQSQHSGIWGNLLNYGSIALLIDGGLGATNDEKDGSGSGRIIFTYVKKPNLVRRKIMGLCIHDKTLDDECMTIDNIDEKELGKDIISKDIPSKKVSKKVKKK